MDLQSKRKEISLNHVITRNMSKYGIFTSIDLFCYEKKKKKEISSNKNMNTKTSKPQEHGWVINSEQSQALAGCQLFLFFTFYKNKFIF